MKRATILTLCFILFTPMISSAENLTIATWNIENLGGSSRGFAPGYGAGNLPKRSDADIQEMADFIKNEIKVDVIAAQEIAITDFDGDLARNNKLDLLCNKLGGEWKYYLSTSRDGHIPEGHSNIFCAFIYDGDKVNLAKTVEMDLQNLYVGAKKAFDRRPLLGYFEVKKGAGTSNDFLLVNVHLASGQNNDENHLAAMVIIEQSLNLILKKNRIKESDRIVLGDANDNPHAKKPDGTPRYTDFLYQYMAHRKYRDLITENSKATRMNRGLTSVIDHVLINSSADKHIPSEKAIVFHPSNSAPDELAKWRKTYSDHFPVLFKLKIESSDDDVDYH